MCHIFSLLTGLFFPLSFCRFVISRFWQKTRLRGKGKVSRRKGGLVKLEWEWEWLRGMKRGREWWKTKNISHVSVTQSDVFWIE